MQVYYEYRWYYAVLIFILVFALGYYYDTAILIQKIRTLQQERETNKAELLKISDALQTDNVLKSVNAVLTKKSSYAELHEKIILLIKQYELQIKEIIFKSPLKSSLNAELVQIEVHGNLQNNLLFLLRMVSIPFGVVTDFSLSQKERDAHLLVSIYLFKDYQFKSLPQLNKMDQPSFCAANAAYLFYAADNKAKK